MKKNKNNRFRVRPPTTIEKTITSFWFSYRYTKSKGSPLVTTTPVGSRQQGPEPELKPKPEPEPDLEPEPEPASGMMIAPKATDRSHWPPPRVAPAIQKPMFFESKAPETQ